MPNNGPTLYYADRLHAAKYRGPNEVFREAMSRVANACQDNAEHYHAYRDILIDMRFLPAGRVQSAMGSTRVTTPYNCFVSGIIDDSMDGIMTRCAEAAQTMRMGGGIGYDFSTLRPRGSLIRSLESRSSGPVSFMEIFNAMCLCIASAGSRRGAEMAVLRCDHPDIEEFVQVKNNEDRLRGFNLSVGVTDDFMEAVQHDAEFELRWKGKVWHTVRAVDLWEKIMRSTWEWGEPGVIFVDTINRMNNLHYCETITTTNPCFAGETLVWTSDGPKQFAELAEAGNDVSVLTQLDDGKLVYRVMKHPRRTLENANLVEVVLRGTTVTTIRCTPSHEFFLEDGTRRFAKYLQGHRVLTRSIPDHALSEHTRPVRPLEGYAMAAVSVRDLPNRADVYCGTVEETGRFFIYSDKQKGTLVANCAEQPLPPFGACLLGSFNLAKYVSGTIFNYEQFRKDIPVVVRAMDNVIDRAHYPLPQQKREAVRKRRMGLGVTGLANAGEQIAGLYGADAFLKFTAGVLEYLRDHAYWASVELAKEKGAFPAYKAEPYLAGAFIQTLSDKLRKAIAKHGIRNSHLTSIAPTGTISLCADNVSSGIEPVANYREDRIIQDFDGPRVIQVEDYAHRVFGLKGKRAEECTADEHLAVLLCAQRYVDSAVSKTCNVSPDMPWEEFKNIYMRAWKGGAKSCATFKLGGARQGIRECVVDGECAE